MQIVYKNENEGGGSRRADSVGVIIYARRVSRHLKGEYLRGFGRRRIEIQICKGVFGSHQEGVWKRKEGVCKGSRVEKIRARRKENGRVHSRVQESSKREQIQRKAIHRGVQEGNE